jgi:hypothetical protein
MKKALLLVSALLFAVSLLSIGTTSFAGDKVKETGTMKSMDAKTGDMVFCPKGTKDEVSMKADPADIKGLKAGDKVMVEYEKGKVNTVIRIKKSRTIVVPTGC